jgi:ADP-ribose pyrophosphatase YjhB (NUDIX family)
MKNSCGVAIVCDNKVLLCRATKVWDHEKREVWGLPKGLRDEGETPQEAAIREVYEETGIKLHQEGHVVFMHQYKTKNRVYSFHICCVQKVDIEKLKCITMVDEDQRNYPEVDKYVMADFGMFKHLVFNSQARLLDEPRIVSMLFGKKCKWVYNKWDEWSTTCGETYDNRDFGCKEITECPACKRETTI